MVVGWPLIWLRKRSCEVLEIGSSLESFRLRFWGLCVCLMMAMKVEPELLYLTSSRSSFFLLIPFYWWNEITSPSHNIGRTYGTKPLKWWTVRLCLQIWNWPKHVCCISATCHVASISKQNNSSMDVNVYDTVLISFL